MTATAPLLRRLRPFLAAPLAVLAAGCATHGGPGVVERLDRATGLTFVRADRPLVFAHGELGISGSERDYLYLGPVETNRQGVREYYLWVGVGTTLDRGYSAPGTDQPRSLFLRVHGEWMQLELKPLAALAADLRAGHVYRTAVKTRAELTARVTLNQLELMDGDALQSIRVADASGRTSLYVRWKKVPAWPAFVAYARGKPGDGGSHRRASRHASNEP